MGGTALGASGRSNNGLKLDVKTGKLSLWRLFPTFTFTFCTHFQLLSKADEVAQPDAASLSPAADPSIAPGPPGACCPPFADTLSAAYYAQFALNGGRPVGQSIPATEHSVMTSWPSGALGPLAGCCMAAV